MDKILNNLYIGNVSDAQQALNISKYAVLSVGAEFTEMCPEDEFIHIPLRNKNNTEHKVISLWDGESQNIVKHLRESWNFINTNISNKPVLIHCMAGKSRSVSILWSYFILQGIHPIAAYKIIKTARNVVDPAPIFMQEILQFFNFSQKDIEFILNSISEINSKYVK